MDQIISNNNRKLKNCIIHPQNKVTFIQINEILTQHNSKILQCQDCVEQDLQFKGSNYMLIKNIIENSETDFHLKWPPLNDQSIIQKIQLKASSLNSTQEIFDQINSFFTQLKNDIIQKLDVCQKKAMKQAEVMYFGKEQVLKRYQEISQIKNLKSLLIQNQNSSYDIYQQKYKEFIQKVESQKDKKTEQLQELLNQCEKIQKLINFDKLNQSKPFILDFFDSLNIFEQKKEDQFKINRLISNLSTQQQDNSKIKSIINDIQLFKSNLYDGNQRIEIIKNMNNQLEISINQANYQGKFFNYATSCISQILQRDKKYKCRFQIQNGCKGKGYFMIGLMQNKNFNSNIGYQEKMSYCFQIQNNKMKHIGGYGIEKFVKGNNQQLLNENTTLELRVWVQGQYLEVLDYPNYNCQVQIKDEYKKNLLQFDLCLYFYLACGQDKYILQEAFIVDDF